jgi:hypothetical protein
VDSKYSGACDKYFFKKFVREMKSAYNMKGDGANPYKLKRKVFEKMSNDFKVPIFTVKKKWVLKVCPEMCLACDTTKCNLQADLITQ